MKSGKFLETEFRILPSNKDRFFEKLFSFAAIRNRDYSIGFKNGVINKFYSIHSAKREHTKDLQLSVEF